jgi:hypothetical protein
LSGTTLLSKVTRYKRFCVDKLTNIIVFCSEQSD